MMISAECKLKIAEEMSYGNLIRNKKADSISWFFVYVLIVPRNC